jgi:hypothetical protein
MGSNVTIYLFICTERSRSSYVARSNLFICIEKSRSSYVARTKEKTKGTGVTGRSGGTGKNGFVKRPVIRYSQFILYEKTLVRIPVDVRESCIPLINEFSLWKLY